MIFHCTDERKQRELPAALIGAVCLVLPASGPGTPPGPALQKNRRRHRPLNAETPSAGILN